VHIGDAGKVAAGPVEARDEADLDRANGTVEDNRNAGRGSLGGKGC